MFFVVFVPVVARRSQALVVAPEDAFRAMARVVHYVDRRDDDLESEEWKALLSLAAFPRAYVKLSAAFRVSTEPFPHADARPAIRKLLAAFGKERLLWGTDFPWVTQKDGGYGGAWSLVERGDEAEGSDPLLTSDEKLWIYGKTASSLYFKEA